jgi:hypothetical protein
VRVHRLDRTHTAATPDAAVAVALDQVLASVDALRQELDLDPVWIVDDPYTRRRNAYRRVRRFRVARRAARNALLLAALAALVGWLVGHAG